MELKAGPISGNPLCGLCQRVVIEAKQIFDGCVMRLPNENLILTLHDYSPGATAPYSFMRCESSGNTVISNLVITPMEGNRSRVRCDITCPLIIYFNDGNGNFGNARSEYVTHRDVVVNTPEPTLAQYTIESATAIVSTVGAFTSDTTVNISCCIVQTIKVAIIVDLLVPAYCYASYPSCTDFTDDICRGMFSLPLFPSNRF